MQIQQEIESKYGLPVEVKFCKKCVMSNQRPMAKKSEYKHDKNSASEGIEMQDDVCSACNYHDKKQDNIDWGSRQAQLKEICDKNRRNDGRYDCVVAGSGGKDSIMISHILKDKYNMNPLTVTWAPTLYTDVGWRNMQNWIASGMPNLLFHPNGKVHRLITKLSFKNMLHPFQPFIFGQKNYPVRVALNYDIPLVFYGEPPIEYGDPSQKGETGLRHERYHTGTDFENMALGGVKVKELIREYGLTMADLTPYLPLDVEEFQKSGIEVHYLGFYEKWDPQEAYYYAVKHSNFESNDQRTEGSYGKYSSIDDKMDWLHWYTYFIKFGIGRATHDAAQEIRNIKITREEGVALVKKFDSEFPQRYFKDFLEYMDIDEKEFWETVDKFRSPHIWKKDGDQWLLRSQVENI